MEGRSSSQGRNVSNQRGNMGGQRSRGNNAPRQNRQSFHDSRENDHRRQHGANQAESASNRMQPHNASSGDSKENNPRYDGRHQQNRDRQYSRGMESQKGREGAQNYNHGNSGQDHKAKSRHEPRESLTQKNAQPMNKAAKGEARVEPTKGNSTEQLSKGREDRKNDGVKNAPSKNTESMASSQTQTGSRISNQRAQFQKPSVQVPPLQQQQQQGKETSETKPQTGNQKVYHQRPANNPGSFPSNTQNQKDISKNPRKLVQEDVIHVANPTMYETSKPQAHGVSNKENIGLHNHSMYPSYVKQSHPDDHPLTESVNPSKIQHTGAPVANVYGAQIPQNQNSRVPSSMPQEKENLEVALESNKRHLEGVSVEGYGQASDVQSNCTNGQESKTPQVQGGGQVPSNMGAQMPSNSGFPPKNYFPPYTHSIVNMNPTVAYLLRTGGLTELPGATGVVPPMIPVQLPLHYMQQAHGVLSSGSSLSSSLNSSNAASPDYVPAKSNIDALSETMGQESKSSLPTPSTVESLFSSSFFTMASGNQPNSHQQKPYRQVVPKLQPPRQALHDAQSVADHSQDHHILPFYVQPYPQMHKSQGEAERRDVGTHEGLNSQSLHAMQQHHVPSSASSFLPYSDDMTARSGLPSGITQTGHMQKPGMHTHGNQSVPLRAPPGIKPPSHLIDSNMKYQQPFSQGAAWDSKSTEPLPGHKLEQQDIAMVHQSSQDLPLNQQKYQELNSASKISRYDQAKGIPGSYPSDPGRVVPSVRNHESLPTSQVHTMSQGVQVSLEKEDSSLPLTPKHHIHPYPPKIPLPADLKKQNDNMSMASSQETSSFIQGPPDYSTMQAASKYSMGQNTLGEVQNYPVNEAVNQNYMHMTEEDIQKFSARLPRRDADHRYNMPDLKQYGIPRPDHLPKSGHVEPIMNEDRDFNYMRQETESMARSSERDHPAFHAAQFHTGRPGEPTYATTMSGLEHLPMTSRPDYLSSTSQAEHLSRIPGLGHLPTGSEPEHLSRNRPPHITSLAGTTHHSRDVVQADIISRVTAAEDMTIPGGPDHLSRSGTMMSESERPGAEFGQAVMKGGDMKSVFQQEGVGLPGYMPGQVHSVAGRVESEHSKGAVSQPAMVPDVIPSQTQTKKAVAERVSHQPDVNQQGMPGERDTASSTENRPETSPSKTEQSSHAAESISEQETTEDKEETPYQDPALSPDAQLMAQLAMGMRFNPYAGIPPLFYPPFPQILGRPVFNPRFPASSMVYPPCARFPIGHSAAPGESSQEGTAAVIGSSLTQDPVCLDVGGRIFEVLPSTFLHYPDSLLNKLLNRSDSVPLNQRGCLFFDRDGYLFECILAFARTGKLTIPPNVSLAAIMEEAKYFHMAKYMFNCPENRVSEGHILFFKRKSVYTLNPTKGSPSTEPCVFSLEGQDTLKIESLEVQGPCCLFVDIYSLEGVKETSKFLLYEPESPHTWTTCQFCADHRLVFHSAVSPGLQPMLQDQKSWVKITFSQSLAFDLSQQSL